jgi:hypothetical protein
MSIVFSGDELDLIEMLLTRAESEINIEINHCRNLYYKLEEIWLLRTSKDSLMKRNCQSTLKC